jgi:hypothetical protein
MADKDKAPFGDLLIKRQKLINSASVTLTLPIKGSFPDFETVLCGDPEIYTAEIKNWCDESVPKKHWNYMRVEDVFLPGHLYTVTVSIIPKEGYCFAQAADDGGSTFALPVMVTINGKIAEQYFYNIESGALEFLASFTEGEGFINEAFVTVTSPDSRKHPDYDTAVSGDPEKYKAEIIAWSLEASGNVNNLVKMSSTDLFEPGKRYYLYLRITANPGFTLFNGVTYTRLINAGSVGWSCILEWSSGSASYLTAYAIPEEPGVTIIPRDPDDFFIWEGKEKISTASVRVTAPVEGGCPDYETALSGDPEKYTAKLVSWDEFDATCTPGKLLDPNSVFKTGCAYLAKVSLIPLEGYTFDVVFDSLHNAVSCETQVTVNREHARVFAVNYCDGSIMGRANFEAKSSLRSIDRDKSLPKNNKPSQLR